MMNPIEHSLVEVVKTNITSQRQANVLEARLIASIPDIAVNFGIEDCDHILRIESLSKPVSAAVVIDRRKTWGYVAEVLEDCLL